MFYPGCGDRRSDEDEFGDIFSARQMFEALVGDVGPGKIHPRQAVGQGDGSQIFVFDLRVAQIEFQCDFAFKGGFDSCELLGNLNIVCLALLQQRVDIACTHFPFDRFFCRHLTLARTGRE